MSQNPARILTRRVLALSALAATALAAAGLDLSAEVDRTTVGMGEPVRLTVTVSGPDNMRLPEPRLPDLADFTRKGSTSGQYTHSSERDTSARQQTACFIYFLEPEHPGMLTIGPVTVRVKGKTTSTKPITIAVLAGGKAPAPERGLGPNGVLLSVSVDRKTVYVGEQVTVTYVLRARNSVANLILKDAPEFNGFWTESLDEPQELRWQPVAFGDQSCSTALVRRVALFPSQPGELEIGRMSLAGLVTMSGWLFRGEVGPFSVSSAPLRIVAKPLPDADKPVDFKGGVGDFTLSAALNKTESRGGEPLLLDVTVAGSGGIGIVGQPGVVAPAGLKLLAPRETLEARRSGNRVAGTRTWSFPVVPQAEGQHVIPAISMSFFSPEQGRYYTLSAGPLAFVSTRATVAAALDGTRPVGTDIHHIKSASGSRAALPAGQWPWLLYPPGVAVLVSGAVAGRRRRRLETDKGYARRSRSGRLARGRLTEAQKHLNAGNEPEFYAALNRAVTGFVGDRFNIEASGMTGEQLRAEMAARGVELDTSSALLALMSDCDAARFSGGGNTEPRIALERARRVMERLG
jgi:hypothetical protein